jgi:hypothetical protein
MAVLQTRNQRMILVDSMFWSKSKCLVLLRLSLSSNHNRRQLTACSQHWSELLAKLLFRLLTTPAQLFALDIWLPFSIRNIAPSCEEPSLGERRILSPLVQESSLDSETEKSIKTYSSLPAVIEYHMPYLE